MEKREQISVPPGAAFVCGADCGGGGSIAGERDPAACRGRCSASA
jgi:hypothetical protein